MKDELVGQIMRKFVGLRPKTYAYLKDNEDESTKAKGTERRVIKKVLSLKISKFAQMLLKLSIK